MSSGVNPDHVASNRRGGKRPVPGHHRENVNWMQDGWSQPHNGEQEQTKQQQQVHRTITGGIYEPSRGLAAAFGGGMMDQMRRMKHEHVASIPPAPRNHPPLERSQNYMEKLRESAPRKHLGHGVHAKYGGPVEQHASEFCFGVHIDGEKDRQRDVLHPGKGECFSAGLDMASVIVDGRVEGGGKVKGSLFKGEDGEWLKQMWKSNCYSSGRTGDGHAAPGAPLGWAGKWPLPPDEMHKAMKRERREMRDKWAGPRPGKGSGGYVAWQGDLV